MSKLIDDSFVRFPVLFIALGKIKADSLTWVKPVTFLFWFDNPVLKRLKFDQNYHNLTKKISEDMMIRKLTQVIILLSVSVYSFANVKHIVIFGDSLSDIGNTYYLTRTLNKEPDTCAQYLVDPMQKNFDTRIDQAPINTMSKQFLKQHGNQLIQDTGILLQKLFSQAGVPIVPEKPYYDGHFSNSCVWNEYLADKLQLKRKQNINTNNPDDLAQFDNRAFGGSWTVTDDHEFWHQINELLKKDKIWQKQFYTDLEAAFVDRLSGKFIPPSFTNILNAYLNEHSGHADKDSLYIVFYGGNDYLN